ncbi:hypothetical protein MMC28_005812 [Mycoblastus sanguinarius]|nr:hypothetical protein [Mycoblastus sanguinarius]
MIAFDHYEQFLAPQIQGYTIIKSRHENVVLQIAVCEYSSTNVDVSYKYSRPARHEDPLHKPDRPIPGATDIPEEFYTKLQELEGLGRAFAEVFAASKVRQDRVLHRLMRSVLGSPEDIHGLADRGVRLVDDAVHAMPILGGEGGNTAMKDGVNLAEHIAVHGPQGIKSFSSVRYDMWKNGVEQSERRLSEMHSATRSSL